MRNKFIKSQYTHLL